MAKKDIFKVKWEDITVQQFQEIYRISQEGNQNEVNLSCKIVSVIYDLTDKQVDELSVAKFNKYRASISFLLNYPEMPGEAVGAIKLSEKHIIPYNPKSLTLGKYIDINSFVETPVENLHFILATLLRDNSKNAVEELNRLSDEILGAKVIEAYHSVMQFIKNLNQFNQSYSGLFGMSHEEEDSAHASDGGVIEQFNKRYGWIFSATQLAELKRVELDRVYELNIVEALNYLSYLKAKWQYNKAMFELSGSL